ncbi:MAG TPA: cupredoxin domain-containing protein [Acidimicrobiia bacterium]|jgi:plastocyanin|nr:cupredoxin domain-containing protein [Acidimicrobiia bacterium]
MFARTKVTVAAAIAALSFTAIGIVSHDAARATPAFDVQQENPTITITREGYNFRFSPTQLDAKVGQPITVTNNDTYGTHSVTEKSRSFSVDVPPNSSKTLTVSKAGNYQYLCDWHTDAHEPKYASLNVS